mmetsp:Transcript_21999/g.19552  ORF Transcript_21999/g.19552 Transcript_21999/m.19552 type:complete len:133 (-) Transcript_21999:417-815(-)
MSSQYISKNSQVNIIILNSCESISSTSSLETSKKRDFSFDECPSYPQNQNFLPRISDLEDQNVINENSSFIEETLSNTEESDLGIQEPGDEYQLNVISIENNISKGKRQSYRNCNTFLENKKDHLEVNQKKG